MTGHEQTSFFEARTPTRFCNFKQKKMHKKKRSLGSLAFVITPRCVRLSFTCVGKERRTEFEKDALNAFEKNEVTAFGKISAVDPSKTWKFYSAYSLKKTQNFYED